MVIQKDPSTLNLSLTGPASAQRPVGERHRLLVWLGDSVQAWNLPLRGEVVVGRTASADIRVELLSVSRQHAKIIVEPGSARIQDLDSQNGTRLNGERVVGERTLAYGDIIGFGDVTAVFTGDQADDRPSDTPHSPNPMHMVESAGPPDQRIFEIGSSRVLVADAAMLHVYTQLARLAPTDLSVLILGETGTGKELAASALHFWSKRWKAPLVAVNGASLPENLAESELFGYERGAFSGAAQGKPGLLESAPGGTIFLDEIGDLSAAVQAKLLRVLETRRLTRLGSVHERTIDVRIIAATHRNLQDGVRAGWFREDLYYRLSVAVVRLPPLRMRRRELPLMARRFLEDACREVGRAPMVLTEGAMERLAAHSWPGNVRELKNLMAYLATAVSGPALEAADVAQGLGNAQGSMITDEPTGNEGHGIGPPAIASESTLREAMGGGAFAPAPGLPPAHAAGAPLSHPAAVASIAAPGHPDGGAVAAAGAGAAAAAAAPPFRPLAEASREFERKSIEAALAATGGNKSRAAKLLGVPLRTFMDKIKRHGL